MSTNSTLSPLSISSFSVPCPLDLLISRLQFCLSSFLLSSFFPFLSLNLRSSFLPLIKTPFLSYNAYLLLSAISLFFYRIHLRCVCPVLVVSSVLTPILYLSVKFLLALYISRLHLRLCLAHPSERFLTLSSRADHASVLNGLNKKSSKITTSKN